MALVVLDTDVLSGVIKGALPDSLAAKLVDNQLIATFVTVGELSRWLVYESSVSATERLSKLDQFHVDHR